MANQKNSYLLLDSGEGLKLERFGPYTLIRPCPQAIWQPQLPSSVWKKADATFTREKNYHWEKHLPLPESWHVEMEEIHLLLRLTDFGHLGLFPEHAMHWRWMEEKIKARPQASLLNLFAYSGGASLVAAKAGASVCHVDSARGMVQWARDNAALNHLNDAPIRWIVEDARKFIKRVEKRQQSFDAIVLDPPSFGRGASGEIFKIEEDLIPLIDQSISLLSAHPLFLLLSCHTPGYTPTVLGQLLGQRTQKAGLQGSIEIGEMELPGDEGHYSVPSGTYARWISYAAF